MSGGVDVATIGKAAPAWKGNALLPNLEMKEIGSEQFKGKWLVVGGF
jgi:hypothetical protein